MSFVYAAVRRPFGRFGGALAGVRPDDLAGGAMRAVLARAPGLDPGAIDEVVWGNANGAGEENRNVGRMAALLAGLPVSVPGTTVNRLCGSSLDAAMIGSRAIETGDAMDLAVGAKQVFVMMTLFTNAGEPKLVPSCSYPLTAVACVSRVYTDHAVFAVGPDGVTVLETFGTTVGELSARLDVLTR